MTLGRSLNFSETQDCHRNSHSNSAVSVKVSVQIKWYHEVKAPDSGQGRSLKMMALKMVLCSICKTSQQIWEISPDQRSLDISGTVPRGGCQDIRPLKRWQSGRWQGLPGKLGLMRLLNRDRYAQKLKAREIGARHLQGVGAGLRRRPGGGNSAGKGAPG